MDVFTQRNTNSNSHFFNLKIGIWRVVKTWYLLVNYMLLLIICVYKKYIHILYSLPYKIVEIIVVSFIILLHTIIMTTYIYADFFNAINDDLYG